MFCLQLTRGRSIDPTRSVWQNKDIHGHGHTEYASHAWGFSRKQVCVKKKKVAM